MKYLITFLIGIGGLIGPGLFWLIYGPIIQTETPEVIELNSNNIEDYTGKLIAIRDACLPDFALQTTKNGVIEEELIPLITCDSVNQLNVKVFLRIKPPLFSSVEDIYSKGEESDYGLLVGKLEKSQANLTSSSGRIIKNAGFDFDPNNSLQLISHFDPWKQYTEIWIFLIVIPVGSIIFMVRYLRHEKNIKD